MATSRRAASSRPRREPHFTPALFDYLRDLAKHNDRQWFEQNRERYEAHVKLPLLRFVSDLGPALARVSRSFVADPRPVGGSMFRIYRDTRFARDKSPYKTHAAAQFRHRDSTGDVHAPGFYLHLEPGESFGGGGLWHPEPADLAKVRDRIVAKPKEWGGIVKGGKVEILGDRLKRPPAGYDAGHPHVEYLKHKDYYAGGDLTDRDVVAPDFLERYVEVLRGASPLVRFLCQAVGVSF